MKSFYKEWLKKLNAENTEAISSVKPTTTSATPTTPVPSTSAPIQSESIPSTSRGIEKNRSVNRTPSPQPIQPIPASQTDIIFETNELQMIIEKGAFQRQKRFRFQDHLFYVKIRLKNENQPIPFLKDLLDFIHDGLIYLMETIKRFYNEKDENICYLTLHQNPMVIGLNSGKNNMFYNISFSIMI